MEYLKPSEIAKKWQVSVTIVRRYCTEGRIEGAEFNGETWLIPENAIKPERKPREEKPPQPKPQPPLVKKLRQQKTKKMFHGLYDYVQTNLTYSNGRMASNRLMLTQITEIFETDKVKTGFEPIKVDDLIEATDHMLCVDHIIDTATQALTQTYIKRLHFLMFYGTFDERRGKCRIGVYRTKANNLDKLKAPAAKDINSQMSKLLGEYERLQEVTLLQILDFHVRFERIRPFDDGNGRIGRLLMFKECLRHGVTPFILDDKRRSAYLEGLRLWDLDRSVLAAPCLEAQKRFENVIDTQRLLEEHHRQLLRDGFFRDKKRFDAEMEGK